MHCVGSSCPYVALLHIVWTFLAFEEVAERSMRARNRVKGGMCNLALIRCMMQLSACYMRWLMGHLGFGASYATVFSFLFLFSMDPFATAADPSSGRLRRIVGSSQHPRSQNSLHGQVVVW